MSNGTGTAVAPIKAFRADVERMRPELEKALQGRIPLDYYERVLITTVQRTPRLLECDRLSLLAAITESAQMGLIPDGVTGYGYIVPRYDRKKECFVASFQAGYKGLIQYAYRGGSVTKVVAREVCERDAFEFQQGTDEWVRHRPAQGDRGDVTYFYAIAWLKGGETIFVVLPNSRVAAIRDRATKQNRGKMTPAWREDYVAMGRKTALRDLFRWLPVEVGAQELAAKDEMRDMGIDEPREADAEVVDPVAKMAQELAEDEGDKPEPEVQYDENGEVIDFAEKEKETDDSY